MNSIYRFPSAENIYNYLQTHPETSKIAERNAHFALIIAETFANQEVNSFGFTVSVINVITENLESRNLSENQYELFNQLKKTFTNALEECAKDSMRQPQNRR